MLNITSFVLIHTRGLVVSLDLEPPHYLEMVSDHRIDSSRHDGVRLRGRRGGRGMVSIAVLTV